MAVHKLKIPLADSTSVLNSASWLDSTALSCRRSFRWPTRIIVSASVQWPPMTMAFSVTEDQLKGLTSGDRVSFSFRLEGGRATIVSIRK